MPEKPTLRRSTNEVLPPTYYRQLLKLLIAGLTAGLTHAAIAGSLNADGLTTHAGLRWSAESVKVTLRNLRQPHTYPSKVYDALVRLVAENEISVEEAKPLRTSRYINEETTNV